MLRWGPEGNDFQGRPKGRWPLPRNAQARRAGCPAGRIASLSRALPTASCPPRTRMPPARPSACQRLRRARRMAAGCLLLCALPAMTQNTAAKATHSQTPGAASKPAKTKAANKAASPRQKLSDQAKGLALASATTEAISAEQLDIATRVLTGQADCEFKQIVQVLALPGKPGLFTVEHLGKRFVMAPRQTSTGAVRLEDPSAGVLWLQIPAKSMLRNARIGQRMVDSCLHAEQRGALLAAVDPSQALGIELRAESPAADQATLAASASASASASAAAEAEAEAAAAAGASAVLADTAAALPPADAASTPTAPPASAPTAPPPAPVPAQPPAAPAAAPLAEPAASAAAPAASR